MTAVAVPVLIFVFILTMFIIKLLIMRLETAIRIQELALQQHSDRRGSQVSVDISTINARILTNLSHLLQTGNSGSTTNLLPPNIDLDPAPKYEPPPSYSQAIGALASTT